MAKLVFRQTPEIAYNPITGMEKIVKSLKSKTYGIYTPKKIREQQRIELARQHKEDTRTMHNIVMALREKAVQRISQHRVIRKQLNVCHPNRSCIN